MPDPTYNVLTALVPDAGRMVNQNVQDFTNLFTVRDELQEYISTMAPYNDSLGVDGGESTIVYDVPFQYLTTICAGIVGYSWVDTAGSTRRLRRYPPMRHPRYPWLHAVRVNIKPFKPGGIVGKTLPDDFQATVAYEKYYYARVTVGFQALPCDFFYDSQGVNEWERYTYLDPEPKVEQLAVQGGGYTLTFNETGTPSGAQPGPTAGVTKFPAYKTDNVYMTVYMLHWLWVPHDWIFDRWNAKQFVERVNKVNDATFMGFPAGTLLVGAPKFERKLWPVRARTMAPFAWHVHLPLIHFDPPRGNSGGSVRGHNLMPWRANGYWYDALRNKPDGTIGTERFFQTTDVTKLFGYHTP